MPLLLLTLASITFLPDSMFGGFGTDMPPAPPAIFKVVPSSPSAPPVYNWGREPATGDMLVLASSKSLPAKQIDYAVSDPPGWDRWVSSEWLCVDASGDWRGFLYAQQMPWMLVEAMGVTDFGVGSELHIHMDGPAEMHLEAFMHGIPSVPGVDTHQWQHYYFDWKPYISHIPISDDQAWQATWLQDGTQWIVMSGRSGAWQYHTHQGLSEDGLTFWSRANIQPANISVGREFRRVGNLTSEQLHTVISQQRGSVTVGAAVLLAAVALLAGACYAIVRGGSAAKHAAATRMN
jgi:hypothetical protein